MYNIEDDEKFVKWAENFCVIAAQEFHIFTWTVNAVRTNFYKHYERGMTPYQVLSKEICESVDDRKKKSRPKR